LRQRNDNLYYSLILEVGRRSHWCAVVLRISGLTEGRREKLTNPMSYLGTHRRGRATEADRLRPASRCGVFGLRGALSCVEGNVRLFWLQFGYKIGIGVALLLFVSLSASAAQMAILRNGFAIRHERREVRGNVTRLFLTAAPDNYVDVPTPELAGFEEDDTPVLPLPVSVPTPVISLDEVVRAACARNNVDPDLVNSLIAAESGFNPNAVSRKGAQGLMQLMPRTAAWLGVPNALDPASNVEGGTRYLRELLVHYNNDVTKALAAYNAGPERVEQYHGLPPYPETVAYVARIIRDLNRKKLSPPRPQPVPAIQSPEHPRFKATSSQAPTTAPRVSFP
jgi:hypothetical protein